jgi:hypothetical protein
MSERAGTVLWIAAGLGFALIFVGALGDLPNLTLVGGAIAAFPLLVAATRIASKPPPIAETINAEMIGLPKHEQPTELSENEAKSVLRDIGGEPRPK